MDSSAFTSSWIGMIVGLFLLVLAILWFLLPFIIYSIQKRSMELVSLNKLILSELKKLNQGIESISAEGPSTSKCPSCGQVNSLDVLECIKCGYELPIVR